MPLSIIRRGGGALCHPHSPPRILLKNLPLAGSEISQVPSARPDLCTCPWGNSEELAAQSRRKGFSNGCGGLTPVRSAAFQGEAVQSSVCFATESLSGRSLHIFGQGPALIAHDHAAHSNFASYVTEQVAWMRRFPRLVLFMFLLFALFGCSYIKQHAQSGLMQPDDRPILIICTYTLEMWRGSAKTMQNSDVKS